MAWTNTRTYCTDKNIYQQNTEKNRMFPTPNTKISARSARSQSVICFQLGIIVKKGHAINCPWKTGDSAPSTPDKGSVRNFPGRISFFHCWRSNRRPLFAQNSSNLCSKYMHQKLFFRLKMHNSSCPGRGTSPPRPSPRSVASLTRNLLADYFRRVSETWN